MVLEVEEILLKITKQIVDMLDSDLSIEELHTALRGLENAQMSVTDPVPGEFYQAFWSVLGQDLCDVPPDSLNEGALS